MDTPYPQPLPYILYADSNLWYLPPAYMAATANKGGVKFIDGLTACGSGKGGPGVIDIIPPANADYNAGWNVLQLDPQAVPLDPTGITCFANQGRGYWGNFSATPGVHDVPNADPQFVDITRNLETFDTAFLGNSIAAAWSASN